MIKRFALGVMLAVVMLSGCKTAEKPEYSRELPEGAYGLRRVTDPARLPDLTPAAEQLNDPRFVEALERSLKWYGLPSSQQHFPSGPISHAHAWASSQALSELARMDTGTALMHLRSEFDVWESVGWDGNGTVFFTGYYTPVFRASRVRTPEFSYPLYRRPSDLVSDEITGEVKGRRTGAGFVPYPSRAEIEAQNLLNGTELVWLPNKLDAYLIHVNGSAKLELTDGSTMTIGYAGTNGREYTSIGKLLVREGKIEEHRLSLPAIRDYFQQHPEQLSAYVNQNERYVFFREYDGSNWPAGSLGVKVTPMHTLATDKTVFPRGCAVMVDTTMPSPTDGQPRPVQQLMMDQDTGGAIRAAGRGDIYIGTGDHAGRIAGRQAAEGRMYYLLLKRERVQSWYDRIQKKPGTPSRVSRSSPGVMMD